MAPLTPVTLSGDNLGQRHRHLNSLVREAHESGAKFPDVEALPELSPLDRLFKIDLAVKLQHVHYIIHNLKHDDMLYVSRALRATWLVHHQDIINPKHLEDVLFPEMLAPAVTRMKHWLYINLREPAMCQQFYQHYKPNSFDYAIKFLNHCSQDFILEEVPNILAKISCHYLKVLCEKCPRVAKIYFDALATDDDVKARYLAQEKVYYNSVKCVLKSDADVFLDITEKYFNMNSFSRLSPSATDYIVRCHKARLWNKLELYAAYILHIPSLAARLSVEECQEVVLQLARASYLQYRFSYKAVEPLIKRLSPDKRAAFKKRVFVEKDVGESVPDWPYSTPEPPQVDSDPNVFDDEDIRPVCRMNDMMFPEALRMGMSMKCAAYACRAEYAEDYECIIRVKTDLDRLFDEFRFSSFDRTLHELSQRLGATGSADRRRDIFLVLVSKSGGRTDAVTALLQLAVRHINEPSHSRASILRSLVKRANVWRLPADVWQHLLEFGHGLGLDGGPPEAACREGLHAVVIRQLLAGECEQAVRVAFLNDFSTLAEYSLKKDERERVAVGLQNMLAASAADAEPKVAAERLGQLLDVLKTYRVRVKSNSPVVEAVVALAKRDADLARPLLERLYNAHIARRELLRHNMEFRRDEAALVNALRHDPSALEVKQVVDILSARKTRFNKFVSKLVVYFDQKHDVTALLRIALKEKTMNEDGKEQNITLARVLATILGANLEATIRECDAAGKDRMRLAAALRACAHRARPAINLAEWGWRKAGVKAVATLAMRCREAERASLTRALAAERRTVRVALALSMRSAGGAVLDTFAAAVKLRPAVALRVALLYFRRAGAGADLRVWDTVKPLLSSIDLAPRERLRRLLRNTDWLPSSIKPDYCVTLYFPLKKVSYSGADRILIEIAKLLPDSGESVEKILLEMLDNTDTHVPVVPFPGLYIRYLMLSKSDEDLEKRFMTVGNRFLKQLDALRCKDKKGIGEDSNIKYRLVQIFESLKYNAAFLNTDYPCCLSVIERILTWMRTFMPKQEYFDKYVQVYLTMLYYRAVRQSMKQMPDVFADVKRRKSEGVEAVGFVLGRYIVKEVAQLVETYFDSIIELYSGALANYLVDQFRFGYSRSRFNGAVLKGMLAEGKDSQRRIVVYVLSDCEYDLDKEMTKDIKEQLKNDKVNEIFVHALLDD
nr:uncharacterized protein LOC110382432 isoform X3 [Helicoverpa armigera]